MDYTPGPWTWKHDGISCISESLELAGPEGKSILFPTADIDCDGALTIRITGSTPDRLLISAAPDLLDAAIYALGKLEALCRTGATESGMAEEQLRAAIAKATEGK